MPTSDRVTRADAVIVLVCCAAFTLLVLPELGSRSLWLDEAFTVANTMAPIGEIAIRNGGQMIAYYALLEPIVPVIDSELWLRVPSFLAALASIPIFHALACRLLVERWPAALATALFAANPLLHAYGREARAYSIVIMLSCLSWLAFVDLLDSRHLDRSRALWVAATVLGAYMHLLFLLLVPAQLMAAEIRRRRDAETPGVWRPAGAILLLTAPLAVLALHPDADAPEWVPSLSAGQVVETIGFVMGARFGLASIAVGVSVVIVWIAARTSPGRDRPAVRERTKAASLLCWLAVPLLALAALSVVRPLFVDRYILIVLPTVPLLVAFAARRLAAVHRSAGGIVVGIVAVSYVLQWGYQPITEDWREISQEIESIPSTGSVIVSSSRLRTPVDVYLDWRGSVPEASPVAPDDGWAEPLRTYGPAGEDLAGIPDHLNEVWVLHRAFNHEATAATIEVLVAEGFEQESVWSDSSGRLGLTHHRRP